MKSKDSASRALVIGTSGHAREMADLVARTDSNRQVLLLTEDAEREHCESDRHAERSKWVLGVGLPHRRHSIHIRHINCEHDWPIVTHPLVEISPSSSLAYGVTAQAFVLLSSFSSVGVFSHIGYGATIGHDSVIGKYNLLGPGCRISGGVVLGDRVQIGAGAVVLEGVVIGDGAVVGAGAVVTRDVTESTIVVGVPARSMGDRSKP